MARETKKSARIRLALRSARWRFKKFILPYRLSIRLALRNANKRFYKFISPFTRWFALTLSNAAARIIDYILSFTLAELKRLLKLCVVFVCIAYVFIQMFLLIDFVLRYRAIYGIDHTVYLLFSPARRVFFSADRHESKGEDGDALLAFEEAVEIDKNLLTGYVRIGNLYENHRNFQKALHYFKKAYVVDSHQYYVCKKLGEIYMLHRDYTKAVSLLQRAARLDSRNKEILVLLGKAYEGLGEYVEAIEAYETSLTKLPVTGKLEDEVEKRIKQLKAKVFPR